jgi:dipeptide transport system substrate-binding protein
MKVWAMPVARPYNPNARRMAEMIQADFAKVGVTVEIVSYDWTQYLKLAGDPKHDGAVLAGWTGDNGDPDNFLTPLLGCDGVGSGNKAAWCNKDFDAVIKKAAMISDQSERAKLYIQAEAIFKKEAPWATIAHSLANQPMSTKVKGYLQDPLGSHRFDGVDIDE